MQVTAKRPSVWKVAAIVFVVLSLASWGAAYLRANRAENRADTQEARVDQQEGAILQSQQQTRDLIRQVRKLGEKPVVAPDEVPEVDTSDVDPLVLEALVDDSTRRAVQVYVQALPIGDLLQSRVEQYMLENPPPPGPKGDTGPPPSDRELAAVLAQFFVNNPDALPADGEDGADSTVPGPKGDTGDVGPQGPAGRGIRAVELTDGGCTLVLTLTDDSTTRLGPICGKDGQPGIVEVTTDTACTEGIGFLSTASLSYSPDQQRVTLTCTRNGGGQ